MSEWWKDTKPGKVKITKFPTEKKKPIQKSMAELVNELKAKPKPQPKKLYDGDDPPWD